MFFFLNYHHFQWDRINHPWMVMGWDGNFCCVVMGWEGIGHVIKIAGMVMELSGGGDIVGAVMVSAGMLGSVMGTIHFLPI